VQCFAVACTVRWIDASYSRLPLWGGRTQVASLKVHADCILRLNLRIITTPAPSSGSGSGSPLTVQLWPGSSEWWLGVAVSGGSAATSKVEITDSGSLSSWTALTDETYSYVLDQSVELVLPISVRLTSSSGQQVTLSKVITSWTATTPVNTGMNYGGAASSTPAKATSAPAKATSAPSRGHGHN